MGMKDSVKQRREQKIKSLMENKRTTSQVNPIYEEQIETYKRNRLDNNATMDELDPEIAWKTNPNPWANWEKEEGLYGKRSFVNGPATRKDDESPNRGGNNFRKEFQWKLAISFLLFAVLWGMFRYDTEWTLKGQAFVKHALKDEIDFEAASTWYRNTFAGAPSFIPIFKDNSPKAVGAEGAVRLPIVTPLANSSLVRTFAEMLNGIELAGTSQEQVVAAETGRVMNLTKEEGDGTTIVIQHANQRITVYGMLGQTEVKVNDWVEAGDPIGKLLESRGTEPSLLYFAVKQNDRYIDPVGVIPID